MSAGRTKGARCSRGCADARSRRCARPRPIPGEIAHELRHGKDEERVRGEIFPEPQRNISVDQIESPEERVLRDDAHWKGSSSVGHHREEQVAPGEADPGEGVGRRRAGDEHARHRTDVRDRRVGEKGGDGDVGDAAGRPGSGSWLPTISAPGLNEAPTSHTTGSRMTASRARAPACQARVRAVRRRGHRAAAPSS